jgi:hypothetical protein
MREADRRRDIEQSCRLRQACARVAGPLMGLHQPGGMRILGIGYLHQSLLMSPHAYRVSRR